MQRGESKAWSKKRQKERRFEEMGEARGIGGSLVRDKKAKKKVNSRKWARREVQGEAWSASHDDPSAAFAIAHTRENCSFDIISTIFA